MKFKYLVFCFLTLLSCPAFACSISRIGTGNVEKDVTKAFQDSNAVVIATAKNIEATQVSIEFKPGKIYQEKGDITIFKVIKSYKGIKSHFLRTKTAECCCCGFPFTQGKKYLLYLHHAPDYYVPQPEGYYWTSICERTSPIEYAAEDVKILNRISKEKRLRNKTFR